MEPHFERFVGLWTMFTRTQRVPGATKTRTIAGAAIPHKLIMTGAWKEVIPSMISMPHFLYGPPEKFTEELRKILTTGKRNKNIDFSGHDTTITFRRQFGHQLWWATGIPKGSTVSLIRTIKNGRFGRKKKERFDILARIYYFAIVLFNYFDVKQGIVVSPYHIVEGFETGVKSGDFTTSGKGSSEARLYVKLMQSRDYVSKYLTFLGMSDLPIPELKFEYCEMGDDLGIGFSVEQEDFWYSEINVPPEWQGKPGDEVPDKVRLLEAFLDYYTGAIVNTDKSDNLVENHIMILKKQAFMHDGQVNIVGLIGPIINSLARLERDSSIFNSELVRELFKFNEVISQEDGLLMRYIAVLYNIRDGPYLKTLVTALYYGDDVFKEWVLKTQDERESLIQKVSIDSVEWRLGSQTDWEAWLVRFYEVVESVKYDIENSISSEAKNLESLISSRIVL